MNFLYLYSIFMLVIHSLLCDPTDCSLPVSSVHGISQARILEWVVIPLLQGIFLTQGSNLGLLHCKQILYCLSHQGNLWVGNYGLLFNLSYIYVLKVHKINIIFWNVLPLLNTSVLLKLDLTYLGKHYRVYKTISDVFHEP